MLSPRLPLVGPVSDGGLWHAAGETRVLPPSGRCPCSRRAQILPPLSSLPEASRAQPEGHTAVTCPAPATLELSPHCLLFRQVKLPERIHPSLCFSLRCLRAGSLAVQHLFNILPAGRAAPDSRAPRACREELQVNHKGSREPLVRCPTLSPAGEPLGRQLPAWLPVRALLCGNEDSGKQAQHLTSGSRASWHSGPSPSPAPVTSRRGPGGQNRPRGGCL